MRQQDQYSFGCVVSLQIEIDFIVVLNLIDMKISYFLENRLFLILLPTIYCKSVGIIAF